MKKIGFRAKMVDMAVHALLLGLLVHAGDYYIAVIAVWRLVQVYLAKFENSSGYSMTYQALQRPPSVDVKLFEPQSHQKTLCSDYVRFFSGEMWLRLPPRPQPPGL